MYSDYFIGIGVIAPCILILALWTTLSLQNPSWLINVFPYLRLLSPSVLWYSSEDLISLYRSGFTALVLSLLCLIMEYLNNRPLNLNILRRFPKGKGSFNSPRQKSGLVQTFQPFLDWSEFFKGHQVVESPKKALKRPQKCQKKVKKNGSPFVDLSRVLPRRIKWPLPWLTDWVHWAPPKTRFLPRKLNCSA